MTKRRPAPRTAQAVHVPVSPHRIWRSLAWGFGGLVAVGAMVWATAFGLPQQAATEAAVLGSAAGFTVRQVEIQGAVRQPRLDIYQELLRGGTDSMVALDLSDARARLRALPWVADASVERRWPDRLVVRIVEKAPVAVWQRAGVLRVVDRNGNPLPTDDLAAFDHLPLIVGEGANAQIAGLQQLASTAPAMFEDLKAATWVGGRRWDLKMESGETISLPQGPEAPAALARLAAIHRATPLLGRGFVRLDLRIPDKLVVRVSGESGAVARPSVAPRQTLKPETRPETKVVI